MFKSILFSILVSILLTLSAYSQWRVINSNIGVDIKAIVKVNDGLMVATNGNGLYYSSNNENNWVQKNAGLTNLKVYCLDVDGNKVVAGTRGNGVYISKDGGNSWSATAGGITVPHIYSIGLFGSTIIAGTGGGGIFRSSDEGKSWKFDGGNNYIVAVIKRFNDHAYIGQGTYAYRSTDNGQTWQNYIQHAPSSVMAFAESYTQNGNKNVIVGTLDGIYVSTDDGKSWKLVQNGQCNGLTSIENIVFVGFENTFTGMATAYSVDNGMTWKACDEGLPVQINVRAITSDKEYVYIGTGDGVVWKRKLSDFGISSVSNLQEVNNLEIYPNPANDNVRLSWQMDIDDNVEIILYNHLGQRILTLLNEFRNQGKNEIYFDTKILNSGTYFVKLITGSKFKVEKINIIK